MIGVATVQGAAGPVPVRTIKHGEKVTEPGVYDIPMGWYHDACTAGPGMSSSGLRRLWNRTPRHYWDVSPYNPDRAEDDEIASEALRIGRAAHTLLLEPELFSEQFKTRPSMWDSWRTKDAKEWRADQTRAGVTVMNPDEMLRVVGIATSLREHPLHKEGILDGDLERSIIWQDAKTGLWLKARPDAIPRGSNILADLKCLRAADTESLQRDIYAAGYDMQLALAAEGMRVVLGREVTDHVLVVVESDRPHAPRVAPIPPEEIGRAMLLLRAAINKAAECFAADEWPGYDAVDSVAVYRRDYAIKRIEEQAKSGILPERF